MEEKINNFLEEYTNNFSELFINTFILRYLSEFPEDKLYDVIKNANDMLYEKINKEIDDKFNKNN